MGRPPKQTIDYFPHYCNHGKTIFILEQRYGVAGYAFWFKLLEELGKTNGHCLDLNDETELEFLGAKTGFTATETLEILNLLVKLEAIDADLWKNRQIWSQHFVDNLLELYRKRTVSAPEKPSLQGISTAGNEVNDAENPQSKVKYIKEDINTVKKPPKKQKVKNQYPNTVIEKYYEIIGNKSIHHKSKSALDKISVGISKLEKELLLEDWIKIFRNFKQSYVFTQYNKTDIAFLLQREPNGVLYQWQKMLEVEQKQNESPYQNITGFGRKDEQDG